jgi:hypothetical protein
MAPPNKTKTVSAGVARNAKLSAVGSGGTTETPPSTGSTGGGGSGSSVSITSSERRMKPYAIFEGEFRSLSRATSLATMAYSAAAGLTTYALSLIKDVMVAKTVTPELTAVAVIVLPLCIVAAVGFALAGFWANRWKHETEMIIKRESGDQIISGIFGSRVGPPSGG